MDVVTLRKKTAKAKLGLGKYENTTVEDVLEIEPSYLEWVYFSLSKITFTDDILDKLGITEEFRIEKPGVDANMLAKIRRSRRHRWINDCETEDERRVRFYKVRARIKCMQKRKAKKDLKKGEIRDQHLQGKGRLAWANQGH